MNLRRVNFFPPLQPSLIVDATFDSLSSLFPHTRNITHTASCVYVLGSQVREKENDDFRAGNGRS